jgi:hypothetical protein
VLFWILCGESETEVGRTQQHEVSDVEPQSRHDSTIGTRNLPYLHTSNPTVLIAIFRLFYYCDRSFIYTYQKSYALQVEWEELKCIRNVLYDQKMLPTAEKSNSKKLTVPSTGLK